MSLAADPAAHDGARAASIRPDSLAALAAKQLWRSSAPSDVRAGWTPGDPATTWKAWRSAVADRPAYDALLKGSAKGAHPAAWGLDPSDGATPPLVDWLSRLTSDAASAKRGERVTRQVTDWLARSESVEATVPFAIQAVALAAAAPALAGRLEPTLWWNLIESLRALAEEADTGATLDADSPAETVVTLLLVGELPLTLGRLMPEVRPLHAALDGARQTLADAVDRLTDGEGLLPASLWADQRLPAAALLLASWTRCRALGGSARAVWGSDAQLQYEWLVRQTLRLSDRGSRLALGATAAVGAERLIDAAIALGGDDSDRVASTLRRKRGTAPDDLEAPAASNHSEWAELGVLAAGWRDKAPRIVVAHPDEAMWVEVYAGKHALLRGEWPIDVTVSGRSLRPTDTWECQCWNQDEDGDYLELSIDLSSGARLERQFFLAREEGFAFVAEVLFTGAKDSPATRVATHLPLGEGVGVRPERETRDAWLTVAGEPAAGLMPLALAEWRDELRGGELDAADGCLRLTREWDGRNTASPLWIDFSASRFTKQRTWRQLTIAESLTKVSADVAVGYRAQCGPHQWVTYRSLEKPANRTLLGHNLASEAMIGRFRKDGSVKEYFEIEAED